LWTQEGTRSTLVRRACTASMPREHAVAARRYGQQGAAPWRAAPWRGIAGAQAWVRRWSGSARGRGLCVRVRPGACAWTAAPGWCLLLRSSLCVPKVPLPIPPLSLLSLPCGVRRADLSLQDYFQQTGSWGVVKWKWMHPKLTVLLASKPALISVKQQHPVRPLSPAACRRIGDGTEKYLSLLAIPRTIAGTPAWRDSQSSFKGAPLQGRQTCCPSCARASPRSKHRCCEPFRTGARSFFVSAPARWQHVFTLAPSGAAVPAQ